MYNEFTVPVLKALSDPNRLQIVEILTKGEASATRLLELMDLSQPTLSHHMGILVNSNVVKKRKHGQWIYYSIETETLHHLAADVWNLHMVAKETWNCNEC